jgi:hypothetical protein
MAVLSEYGGYLPSGAPAGVGNDAPTTQGFDLVQIANRDSDYTVALDAAFHDSEDSVGQLTYSITGNSNPGLFDSISIDQNAGTLVLNAIGTEMGSYPSGRATLSVSATDSGGLSVSTEITIDVDYENQPPVISNFTATLVGGNLWLLWGYATDADDEEDDLMVQLTGVFETRVAVNADGYFSLQISLLPGESGEEMAVAADQHGAISNYETQYIGLT